MSVGRKMHRRAIMAALPAGVALLAAACASPPLKLYTLGPPDEAAATAPLGGRPVVIEIRRVTIPDYLDSEDIVTRAGNTLRRSARGRWASRVSVAATHFLTNRLAASRPDALVTDQPQTEAPAFRVLINISTLDVNADGMGTLEANWQIVPRDAAQPSRLERAVIRVTGPVATDQDVVLLYQHLLEQLADRIDLRNLR